MRIRLRLFASLRELTQWDDQVLEIAAEQMTLSELRAHLSARGEQWSAALDAARAVRGAINQRMAQESDLIRDGDEVAFFPPVTGG